MKHEDYLGFWGLKEDPFNDNKKDIRYFYQSQQHTEAIERIFYAISELDMDIVMLTGEVGTGKTFTSIVIMTMLQNKNLTRKNFKVVFLEVSYENFEFLMCEIVNKLTGKVVFTLAEAMSIFKKALEQIKKENGQLVIILDESQNYDSKTLEQIRQLSNYNVFQKCISIILVGQPELRNKMIGMKQLASRIKVKQYLNNLNIEEVPQYIAFRMRQAGFNKNKTPFDPYIKDIYKATGGMPRNINTLCTLLLVEGAINKKKEFEEATVKKIISSFEENIY